MQYAGYRFWRRECPELLRLDPLLLELEDGEFERLPCETEAALLDLEGGREPDLERDFPLVCRVVPALTG